MTVPVFVLVHGAWHGGWCWQPVVHRLREAGVMVYAPTLTGLGERDHLRQPIPGLHTHIQDVVGLIEAEELTDVVLVGHSYAGMVITGVADLLPERIRHLVYLDAAVPGNGDDFISQHPGLSDTAAVGRRQAIAEMADADGWLPPYPVEATGVTGENAVAWLQRRLRSHPLRSWLEPLRLGQLGNVAMGRTYVLATDPPTDLMGYPLHGARAKRSPGWQYREMACGHNLMIIDPDTTSRLLLEAAGRES